jgi:hypothetical protein
LVWNYFSYEGCSLVGCGTMWFGIKFPPSPPNPSFRGSLLSLIRYHSCILSLFHYMCTLSLPRNLYFFTESGCRKSSRSKITSYRTIFSFRFNISVSVSHEIYSCIMKIDAKNLSKTLVNFYQTTQHQIPEASKYLSFSKPREPQISHNIESVI